MPLRNEPHLTTYPDSLGGSLRVLDELLATRFAGLFGGVHILPPFPSSGDRGFAPLTYSEIDRRFGTWEDVRRIGADHDVELDLMVNHLSRRSAEFQDFEQHGRRSEHADLFLTVDKVWPGGEPPAEDLARLSLRRASPFSTFTIAETGERVRVWTTFGRDDPSEQVDLDVNAPTTCRFLAGLLRSFAAQNVRIVRLDAVGYVIKKPGTTGFMVEPEIHGFLDWLRGIADAAGVELLAEVHAEPPVQRRLAARGLWVYDFVLPGLVLHALRTGSADELAEHLRTSPRRQFTMLDCHDGIPVQPDLDGVLSADDAQALVDACVRRGANVSRLIAAAQPRRPAFDAHQVNCTYLSACGDADAYVAARAIQLWAPGIPQIYYVGLLAGENDLDAVRRTGEGRAINRHDYPVAEIDEAIQRPLVQRVMRLIRLRKDHPAFGGAFTVSQPAPGALRMTWATASARATLLVGLGDGRAEVSTRGAGMPPARFRP